MRKILVVFDGLRFSHSVMEYATQLAKESDTFLVGVFLHDLSYAQLSYGAMGEMPYVSFDTLSEIEKVDQEKIKLNVSLFNQSCTKNGLNFKVHLDEGVPFQELLNESAFADLIVMDTHTGFFSFSQETPTNFLKDVLADAYCPVLVVPDSYVPIEKSILCYDGSVSSTHAIKMYSYLFPSMSSKLAKLVSVEPQKSESLAEGKNIKELCQVHFNKLEIDVLEGNSQDTLVKYLQQHNQSAMVVLGAYGRSAISRLFHQSTANKILKEAKSPLFITHL